ncbi:aldo/keto reductase [Symbioplanes lichenis]|uniref:aldo/keto reductase n=1 Tax=Symbioplanes lichenis TaxID=1629072 RepID=UPI002739C490|nr:aldo/keto reductase [Actinoplanes lichenis]
MTTFTLGGDLTVNRLGYGTMQLLGAGYWGEPRDRAQAVAVLRRAVELGVTFIDTADAYGPFVAEDLIREALHPYRDDVVIATKGGVLRTGPDEWPPLGRPEYLRQALEMSLRRLGVERIDLYQLHRVDPRVPLEDSVGELAQLRQEGKIRHIGLSEVSVAQIKAAQAIAPIVSVQNLYNVANRAAQDVLDHAREQGMAFIPWFPMATGELARTGGVLDAVARRHGATPAQIALAWLLRQGPNVLPIPGTASIAHLEENVAALRWAAVEEVTQALD